MLTAEVASAKQRAAAIEAEAGRRLREASLPEATATVAFRKAFLSSGSVAMIRNTSNDSSEFSITAKRGSTSKQLRVETVIDGSGTKDLGESQGWAFVSGDNASSNSAEASGSGRSLRLTDL